MGLGTLRPRPTSGRRFAAFRIPQFAHGESLLPDQRICAAPYLLVAIVLLLTSAFAQTTIHVPADVSTIQGAIQSAANGDTILVAPGTYSENINFLGKAITVEGASAAATILQGGSAPGAVVKFTSGEGRNSVLSSFTIQGGVPATVPDAGGILIYRASPTIQNNIIQNNVGCGIGGYGSSPLITGNLIAGTTGLGEYEEYAVCRDPQGDNSLPNASNPAQGYPANGSAILLAGLPIDNQQAQIIGNTIRNNTAYDTARGIWLADAGAPLVENNIIANNYSYFNGALAAWGNVAPAIIQNLVYDNVSDGTKLLNPAGVDSASIDFSGYAPAYGGITAVFAENTVVYNQALWNSQDYEGEEVDTQVRIGSGPSPVPVFNNIIVGEGPLPAVYCYTDGSVPAPPNSSATTFLPLAEPLPLMAPAPARSASMATSPSTLPLPARTPPLPIRSSSNSSPQPSTLGTTTPPTSRPKTSSEIRASRTQRAFPPPSSTWASTNIQVSPLNCRRPTSPSR
jgi:parallel beta-helix repeat protein